ncbi:MAG: peptidylprolyl isomerase [Jatrophihabitans sp.]|uniref:peptidylprolyl isomerase n=1 Tax=Jatrophihabitans sp. TaxID=1932789 RepID=UPI003F7E5BB2
MPGSPRRGPIAAVVGTLVVLAAVIVAVAISNHSSGGTKSGGRNPTVAQTGDHACDWQPQSPAARSVQRPPSSVLATATVTLRLTTSQGPLTLTLDRAKAPCTVADIVSLADQGYYDGTHCHRLVTEGIYVLQCGDPNGDGSGGPGYTIPDEATGAEQYPAGTVAMARTAEPHSGGSQFFIVDRDSPSLQQGLGTLQYTVFGRVTSGLDVVTKVAAAGTTNGSPDGPPKLPVDISKVAVG